MPEEKQQKIAKTKGRPMLHWVGKKPIDVVQSYPAQLVETVGKGKNSQLSYESLKDNWQNLLFHGDNKEVLSTLIVNGFRGKVDLVYIDPPFDSGADYVRKVELRGSKDKVAGEAQSVLEQTQYTDIWANDNYLQFMYERLILLRELLSEQGSIYLHCDWHKDYHLRFLMDEVFGSENFMGEIVWKRTSAHSDSKYYGQIHDTILAYSKTGNPSWNKTKIEYEPWYIERYYRYKDTDGRRFKSGDLSASGLSGGGYQYAWKGVNGLWRCPETTMASLDKNNKIYYTENGIPRLKQYLDEVEGLPLQTFWDDIQPVVSWSEDGTNYPTQKPEELVGRIIKASSDEDSIILDCFIGSGTAAAVAQKFGRRWIGADINKGAIQTTMKRLQKAIEEQTKKTKLIDENKPASTSILHFRVNNYDFQKQHELKGIIVEKYDVTPVKTDTYFDGTVGERLVKIAELNQPVNKLTVQGVLNELKNRTDDTRDILVIGSGVELGVDAMVADYNKTHAVNKLEVKDIQSDGIIVQDPAEADVLITKKGGKVLVVVNDYLSPTIVKRLEIDRSIFGEKIGDFRAQIDIVLIDTDYNGKTFNIVHADVPEKKTDFVTGKYELELPKSSKQVAVKIIDMLGEETLVVE